MSRYTDRCEIANRSDKNAAVVKRRLRINCTILNKRSARRMCSSRSVEAQDDRHSAGRGHLSLAHIAAVELVAVEVAKIAGIETRRALTRRALIGTAERYRFGIDAIDLFAAGRVQRCHRAVACARFLFIEWIGDGEPRTVLRIAPGNEVIGRLHEALRAEFGEHGIVEGGGTIEFVGSERGVSKHESSPKLKSVVRKRSLRPGC